MGRYSFAARARIRQPDAYLQLVHVGALIPEFSPGSADYEGWHQKEEKYAWGSLILGKPLVGQRVTDTLALIASLHRYRETAQRTIHVAAEGGLTVPALFAAALDSQINSIYLSGGLASYQNLIETELYQYSFANFIPSLLNRTDLPDIASSLALRQITLAGTVDARGHTLDVERVRTIYRTAAGYGN